MANGPQVIDRVRYAYRESNNCADNIRLYQWPITSVGYFCDICSPIVSVPFRSRLRCADNDDVIVPVPRTETARYGPRSFRVAATKIWNMLPPHLKNSSVSREQFKSGLKTWLFVQAYSQEAPVKTV